MTDFRPDFAVGENVLKATEDQATQMVELTENVIPGEALVVVGVNTDGTETVAIISTLTEDVKYIAMEVGVSGDIVRVLHKGRTKLTFGSAFAAGARLTFGVTSKVVDAITTHFVKAVAVDPSIADNDLGFVDFDGGITPLGAVSS